MRQPPVNEGDEPPASQNGSFNQSLYRTSVGRGGRRRSDGTAIAEGGGRDTGLVAEGGGALVAASSAVTGAAALGEVALEAGSTTPLTLGDATDRARAPRSRPSVTP